MSNQESRNKMTFERIKYYRHLFGKSVDRSSRIYWNMGVDEFINYCAGSLLQ